MVAVLLLSVAAFTGASGLVGFCQPAAGATASLGSIHGAVYDASNEPVTAASVMLVREESPDTFEVKTTARGSFLFRSLRAGSYRVSATKPGVGSRTVLIPSLRQGEEKSLDLVLGDQETDHSVKHSPPLVESASGMQLADQPNFTVAGVTDWTAVGGHGSDSTLRTSEALARETAGLEPRATIGNPSIDSREALDRSESKLRAALAKSPGSFTANHDLGEFYCHAGRYSEAVPLLKTSSQIEPGNYANEFSLAVALKGGGDLVGARAHVQRMLEHENNGDLHRLSGEIDEGLGDPLAAVHEEEQAVRLDPSEANYLAWGSELLLHRAVQPAELVLGTAVAAFPKSASLATALGAALFAGALYEESAQRLCEAAELNPTDPSPYVFLGKIEMAAPAPLTCVEPKLASFARMQPANAWANYYYAMAILKRQGTPASEQDLREVERLLNKAVALDPRSGDAYLQLGILQFEKNNFKQAVDFYTRAIEVDAQLGEAHYRLGVAYKKIGEPEKAKREFQLHDDIEKQQADAVDKQRREVRQFLVVLKNQPDVSRSH